MYVFTTRALDFVYTTVGRVKFVYFFRISPVKLKFSMGQLFNTVPKFERSEAFFVSKRVRLCDTQII